MPNYNVGVNLVEGVSSSPVEGISTAISGLIGTFERGPLNKATLISTMTQFERTFGVKPAPGSTSYYSVKAFFRKVGSAPLYIVRVASSLALKASKMLLDSGAANTVEIKAVSEGIWGNSLSVAVAASSILSTKPASNIAAAATSAVLLSTEGIEVGSDLKFDNGTNQEYRRIISINAATKTVSWTTGLTFAYTTVNGIVTSQEFKISLYTNGILTEEHTGLGVNSVTTFYVNKKLISSYITGAFIKATPVNSYLDLPAVAAAASLAAGHDGLSNVLGADYSGVQSTKTGVYAFDDVEGLFRFCCPNPLLTDASPATANEALVQSLLDYANVRVTVTYYSDVPYGTSVVNAKVFGDKFVGRRLILFWPWLKVIEESLDKWLPPSSFVMGIAVEKDFRRGVHKNLGNELLAYTIDLEYSVSEAEGETLNNAGVNTIRKFSGQGIKTYGGRTRSVVTAWRFIHYSELWNYIGKSLAIATQDVPFEPHNSFLWKSVVRRITAFLSNEQRRGSLFDAANPTGIPYIVVMDETNNPPDQVALGIATVRVEYVPTGTAEKFVVELTSSPAGLTISE